MTDGSISRCCVIRQTLIIISFLCLEIAHKNHVALVSRSSKLDAKIVLLDNEAFRSIIQGIG